MENIDSGLAKGGLIRVEHSDGVLVCASAYNALGIARLIQRTGSKLSEPLMIYVDSRYDVLKLAEEFPEKAYQLSTHFWPGPLNIMIHRSENIPHVLNDGNSCITINMPENHDFRDLLKKAGVPLAACADHATYTSGIHCDCEISMQISGTITSETSLVSFLDPQIPTVLSEGPIKKQDIEAVIGSTKLNTVPFGDFIARFASKISPATPCFIAGKNTFSVSRKKGKGKIALVTFGTHTTGNSGFATVINLSPKGDIAEAAANFNSTLIKIDSLKYDAVFFEPLPEGHIGAQLNERLRKIGLDMQSFKSVTNETCCD